MDSSKRANSGKGKNGFQDIFKSGHLRPLTTRNILFYYLPIQGATSFTALSVNVMNPELIMRIFPKRDVTNLLLFTSLAGTGLYIYDRPHLTTAPSNLRICYSAFGALMFSFGSVLMWAVIRSLLPSNSGVGTAIGVVSAVGLIKGGKSYLDFVDSRVVKP